MAITDVLNNLEKAVEDAEKKATTLAAAEQTLEVAQKAYSESLAKVEKLKTELTTRIGDIFPASGRVRQSA